MQTLQFGEIDTLSVKPGCPGEGRNQKTDSDNRPACITEGRFVDGFLSGSGTRVRHIHSLAIPERV